MKLQATILLALLLSSLAFPGAGGLAMADDAVMGSVQTQENGAPLHPQAALPEISALDLSLFGIISLGVIGLFWIRRHTSEL